MKKNLLNIIFASLIIFSCTSENGGKNEILDPIIGSWQSIKITTKFKDGTEEIYLYNDCEQKSTYSFFEDSTIDIVLYAFDDSDPKICSTQTHYLSTFVKGNWENLGNKIYQFPITYLDNGNGKEYSETETAKVSFPNSTTFEYLLDSFHENSREEYIVIVYKKVE